jgi:hypothetical protein
MLQEYITKINPNGILDLDAAILKNLIGKRIKVQVYNDEQGKQSVTINSFIELLHHGPKAEGILDNITREWIHQSEDDENMH